jgi:hypothetical protein
LWAHLAGPSMPHRPKQHMVGLRCLIAAKIRDRSFNSVPLKEYLGHFSKFVRPRRVLAAALAQLGRLDEAKKN